MPAGLARGALQSWDRGTNFLEHSQGGKPELVATLPGSEWAWVWQAWSIMSGWGSCCFQRLQETHGEKDGGGSQGRGAGRTPAGWIFPGEGCREVAVRPGPGCTLSGLAQGRALETWLAQSCRDVLTRTRLAHQTAPAVCRGPFVLSGPLVPNNEKACSGHFKEEMLTDIL